MQSFAGWLIILLLLITVNCRVYGQCITIGDGRNITGMTGDELNAEWSHDSKNLLFQSAHKGTSSIYLYGLANDTVLCLSNLIDNFRNPVWHPDGDKVVFDSDRGGVDRLYVLDLNTNKAIPLFNRKIKCCDASFSALSRQVYFTGYDDLTHSWEIFSYDFVYDNLNKLTDFRLGNSNPDVSSDGKRIVYCKANPFNRTKNLEVINWYGEQIIMFDKFNGECPSWGALGLKLFFVSNMDNEKGELYSIWKDGSHLERLTHDETSIACPVVSPDGTKIAMSVLTESGWDIFIFSFEGY